MFLKQRVTYNSWEEAMEGEGALERVVGNARYYHVMMNHLSTRAPLVGLLGARDEWDAQHPARREKMGKAVFCHQPRRGEKVCVSCPLTSSAGH